MHAFAMIHRSASSFRWVCLKIDEHVVSPHLHDFPHGFSSFPIRLPYSGEILRSYADYDTVLAARFVHFFLSEAIRLGHPPRIIDMGCGRGSYVEVFKSWGLPVMGIDGNLSIPWWDLWGFRWFHVDSQSPLMLFWWLVGE